jgi:hypothetical protein
MIFVIVYVSHLHFSLLVPWVPPSAPTLELLTFLSTFFVLSLQPCNLVFKQYLNSWTACRFKLVSDTV